MEIVMISYGKLRSRGDARPINKPALTALIASIKQLGIINPLRVRATKINEGLRMVDGYEIVAGNHRYKAAVEAEVYDLPCVVMTDDDIQAELVMIDENLCRADLSPAERQISILRRKEIYEILHPETRHGGDRKSSVQNAHLIGDEVPRFTRDTAEKTNRSEDTVKREVRRAKAIGDDLPRVVGTSLDRTRELAALALAEPGERKALIDRAVAGENVSAYKKTVDVPDQEDREQIEAKKKRKLMAAWNDSPPAVQQWFIDTVQVGMIMHND